SLVGTGVWLPSCQAGTRSQSSLSLNMPMIDLHRQRKRGITLVQNFSIDFIRTGCGTKLL
ncbi:MAG TPA: hypothetical protein VE963_14285, partial [Reyranella sp.]|nr:hypothetical protein [Reyranella sp.]